ncbi:MAG: hypothetical protein C5B47_06835 [Verrucomicrobia bacterium]|nr:MAG: hypothetical protein C5B47_06835 [Verrucomicrobiota bacterium]
MIQMNRNYISEKGEKSENSQLLTTIFMSPPHFTFLRRFGSSLVLWLIIALAVILKAPVLYLILICGAGLIAQGEFFRMLQNNGIRPFSGTALIVSAIFLSGSFFYYQSHGVSTQLDFDAAMILFFIIAIFARQMCSPIKEGESLRTVALTLFGILYIPWMLHYVSKIIFLTPPTVEGVSTGQFYALFGIVVTKFSDMGAYVFGSLFGRHRFMSHISPKKTWEGFLGALASAVLGGSVLYLLLRPQLSLFQWKDVICLGILLGGAAVAGDLAESIIKRSAQAKDSSQIIPGIGGILDLIDSLLFTLPILFFYLRGVVHFL